MKLLKYIYVSVLSAAALTAAAGAPLVATVAPAAMAAAAPDAGARAVTGGIEIYNRTAEGLSAEVYSITGAAVWQGAVDGGDTLRLELKAGIYIVRVGDSASRLLVR